MTKLATPLKYLSIKHEEKWQYDWALPTVLLVATVCLLAYIPGGDLLSDEGKVLDRILDLLRLTTGFFFASLGVVASLKNEEMDSVMENSPRLNGMELTRRRFLAYTFGYLAFLSLVTYLVGTALDIMTPGAGAVFVNVWQLAVFSLVVFPFFQIAVIACVGLHYLSERIHQPKRKAPRLAGSKEDSEDLHPEQRRQHLSSH